MTEREALKLALEALQKIYIAPEHEEYIRVWWPACEQAITAIKEALAEPNFCPRCGKRLGTNNWDIHTCTPPQRTWVGLTDEEILSISADCAATHQHTDIHFAQAIEAKLRSKNSG